MATAGTMKLADVEISVRDYELGLIEKAKALRPLLERSAAAQEAKGELNQEVIDALGAMGALKMCLPRRWGGSCTTAETMVEVAIELAKGDPSTAWVMSIINSVIWLASRIPPATQRLIFANGVPRMCAPVFSPTARIEKRGDKYTITGKLGYGSASHHAEWTIIKISDDSGALYGVAVPMSQMRIERTWRVAGMKATGSDTLAFEDLVVDKEQVFNLTELYGGTIDIAKEFKPEMTDYFQSWPMLRTKMLGVLIGTVEGLLEYVVAQSDRPIVRTKYARRADSTVFQARLGEAAAKIAFAHAMTKVMARKLDEIASAGRLLSSSDRAQFRGQTSVISELLVYSVEVLMNLAGSSGYMENSPAQRYWRDFSVGMRHGIFNQDINYEVFGAYMLGVELDVVDPEIL